MKNLKIIIFLFLLSTIPFIFSVNNGFVNFDDDTNIYEANIYDSATPIADIWFSDEMYGAHPLTHTLWYLQGKLFGHSAGSATYFHLVSIFIHSINVVLLFLIIQNLGFEPATSAFIAILFAVHPWRVENVSWVTSQKDLLSAFLFLLAWFSYQQRKVILVFFGVILFFLSLMAKATSIGLPFILLLDDWYTKKEFSKKSLLWIFSYFLVSIAGGYITIQKESYFQMKMLDLMDFSLIEQLLLFGRITSYYVINTFFPPQVSIFYPQWNTQPSNPINWLFLLVPTFLFLYSFYLMIKKRSEVARLVVFAIFGYAIMLGPVAGLHKMPYFIYTYVSDRYAYIPLLFPLILFVNIICNLSTNHANGRYKKAWLAVFVFFIFYWGFRTVNATYLWENKKLWNNVIEYDGLGGHALATAYNNIGTDVYENKEYGKAIEYYKEAVNITPEFGKALFNLGLAYDKSKMFEDALTYYSRAIKVDSEYIVAIYNRAGVYHKMKKWDLAIDEYNRVIKLEPNHARAYYNLGLNFAKKNQWEIALENYNLSIEIDPEYDLVYTNKGVALFSMGLLNKALKSLSIAESINDKKSIAENINYKNEKNSFNKGVIFFNKGEFEKALLEFSKTTSINNKHKKAFYNKAMVYKILKQPDKAFLEFSTLLEFAPSAKIYIERGRLLTSMNKLDEAEKDFRDAIRLDNENLTAHNSIALLLAESGKTSDGLKHLSFALELNPNHAPTYNNIGILLIKQNKLKQAMIYFEKAVMIAPEYIDAKTNLMMLREAFQK